MQDWETIEVQLGRNGEPDQSTLTRIQITDAKHRLRSSKAEEHTRECYDRCDLPALARDGGDVTGNPNTKEQRRVSRGEQTSSRNDHTYNKCIPCPSSITSRMPFMQKPGQHGRSGMKAPTKSTSRLAPVE